MVVYRVIFRSCYTVNITFPLQFDSHPTVTFERAPVTDGEVVNEFVSSGQAIVYILEVTLNTSSSNDLHATFFANPVTGLEMCDANVVRAGENVPCQKIGSPTATYTKA